MNTSSQPGADAGAPNASLWTRKLAALLHDPPSKCLDIRTHGERSDAAFHQAGFIDTQIGDYFRQADHAGAAADRLPFPGRASGLSCVFDGVRNAFRHPMCGNPLPFHAEFRSVGQGFEVEQSVQPVLDTDCLDALPDDAQRWRARFFAHWRLWQVHATSKDWRLAFLPADTRIPDHSIWTHMQVVSALAGCEDGRGTFKPAFLKVQLGPVQDFIAAARSIRDLWSGSYLLSWLMATGLKALSKEIGPDAVVFPSLREQPLFDLHWREELWSKVRIGSGHVWNSFPWSNDDLLTPNLPNVFLAVVPADQGPRLAKVVEDSIKAEWRAIAEAVWSACSDAKLTEDEPGISKDQRRARFDSQVEAFLSIAWRVTPWPESLQDALEMATGFDCNTPVGKAHALVRRVVNMAEKQMPKDDRDSRFYVGGKDDPKDKLNNIGLGWSVLVALNSWQLDAVRQTRVFHASGSGGWEVGAFNNKDSLTGRNEAVAGGEEWNNRATQQAGQWAALFKKRDWLAAPNLIKRVWHIAYLSKAPWNLATSAKDFPMPNTRGIAACKPFEDCDGDEIGDGVADSEKYFAVLALDGDEIGKWVSGEKNPTFSTQLADYSDGNGNPGFGSKSYFEKECFEDLSYQPKLFLDQQRPLPPSYHLQFSEALSNFALRCARPVVEAFHGRLIYAGGDDVLALLPSQFALECAQALRNAFQGKAVLDPTGKALFSNPVPGFLVSHGVAGPKTRDDADRDIPIMVPGPNADCSVGVAIAHFKSPLQDVVRAAQLAEKRAKKPASAGGIGRSAVAITLMKRSGETVEWGAKWEGGLDLYGALAMALDAGHLTSKFPHRFAELLEAYATAGTPLVLERRRDLGHGTAAQDLPVEDIMRIVSSEFRHCLDRQRGDTFPKAGDKAEALLNDLQLALARYMKSVQSHGDAGPSGTSMTQRLIRATIGLCQTVAFAHRTQPESKNP